MFSLSSPGDVGHQKPKAKNEMTSCAPWGRNVILGVGQKQQLEPRLSERETMRHWI